MTDVTVPFYFPVTVDGWIVTEIEGNATFHVYDYDEEYEAHLRTLEVDGVKIVDGVRYVSTIQLDDTFPGYNDMWVHVDEKSGADAIEKYLTGDFYSGPSRATVAIDDARASLAAAAE